MGNENKKIYYLEVFKINYYTAGSKARNDCDNIFKKLQMKKIKISHLFLNKFSKNFIYKLIDQSVSLLLNLKFLFNKNSLIFLQFPLQKKWANIFFYNIKNIQIILIIHDLEGLRFKSQELLNKEIEILNKSKYIISHNKKMTEILVKHGIGKNKIKNLYIFDYILENNDKRINEIKTSDICFAGNLEKSLFIYKLRELKNIKIDIFGINYQKEKNQEDFNYCGAYPPNEIHKKLTGKYGLIWDGDSLNECNGVYGEYLKYNNPHKLSLYIAAGLPVITWKKAAIAEFIEKENIGITVNSLYELEKTLVYVSEEEYANKVSNVMRIREKIIKGDILTEIIKKILIEEKNE